MRKSSRGNPYHDERGRFCSAFDKGVKSEQDAFEYMTRPRYNKETAGHGEEFPITYDRVADNNERLRRMTEDYGEERGKRYADSLDTWLYSEGDDTDTLDEYINMTPAFDGEVYRGLRFWKDENDDMEKFEYFSAIQPNDIIKMNGNASWSSDKETAESFAWGGSNANQVVITCKKNLSSVSIEKYAECREYEVLSHSKASWKVLNKSSYIDDEGATVIAIDVEEIESGGDELWA